MVGSGRAQLTDRHAAAIEEALRADSVPASSPRSSSRSIEQLVASLWRLRRGLPVPASEGRELELARELGLVEPADGAPPRLAPIGGKVSDSLCEWVWWRQRGKRHHHAQEFDAVRVERLRGKRILEIGCGSGVNLLSLQRHADVTGVEIEPIYLRVAAIFARVEGLPLPPLLCARAERLPFADDSFDVALFPGSIYYMEIEQALAEASRVLRPGGRLIVLASDFSQAVRHRLQARRWSMLQPGILLREARGLAGMLAYPWFGRALLAPGAPIHVSRARARRWLARAGLRPNLEETWSSEVEVGYVADKGTTTQARR
jgi:ubiquinone/menaquinone biosynthesis C-methylase UbiE